MANGMRETAWHRGADQYLLIAAAWGPSWRAGLREEVMSLAWLICEVPGAGMSDVDVTVEVTTVDATAKASCKKEGSGHP